MNCDPLSLIKAPDPDRVLRVAEALTVRGHWPGLCGEMARLAATPVAAVEVTPPAVTDLPAYQDAGTRAHWVYRYATADGSAVLDIGIDRTLTGLLCTRRFGGAPTTGARRAGGGAVERSIAQRIANAAIADLTTRTTSWLPLADIDPARDGDVAVVQSFTFSLPISAVPGPQIDLVLSGPALTQSAVSGEIASWQDVLARCVNTIRVPVRSILARPVLSAGEVSRLRPGDVIPIRAPDRVELLAGNYRLAHGTLMEADGHAAIQLVPMMEFSE